MKKQLTEYSDIPLNKVYNFWIDDIDVGKGILVCEDKNYYILHNFDNKIGGKPRENRSEYLYGWCINSIHKIDYQEISKEVNLVGRYLKVLPKAAISEKYLLINKKDERDGYYYTKEYPYEIMDMNWRITHGFYELMPEGFVPFDSSEPKNIIPEYIKCISEIYGLEVGKIYPCNKQGIVMDGIYNNYTYYYSAFKPSTKEAYYNQLLEEAKRKFPIGCSYIGLNLKGEPNGEKYTISENNPYWWKKGECIAVQEGKGIVFTNGKWAKLIEMPEESKTEPEINTHGLKVGDFLPNDVIVQWARKSYNFCNNKKNWKTGLGSYVGDREIEGFEVIDGTVGFKVSGSHTYLKAEGFKEFMDNFYKSEDYSEKVFEPSTVSLQYPLTPKECYPVDVLDKYQQKPVIYSGKKVKSKIVTIFN